MKQQMRKKKQNTKENEQKSVFGVGPPTKFQIKRPFDYSKK
jgi:hypothetical protein